MIIELLASLPAGRQVVFDIVNGAYDDDAGLVCPLHHGLPVSVLECLVSAEVLDLAPREHFVLLHDLLSHSILAQLNVFTVETLLHLVQHGCLGLDHALMLELRVEVDKVILLREARQITNGLPLQELFILHRLLRYKLVELLAVFGNH